ncbi:hypothetical protein [Paraglaciecola sp. MB-3u-78]|uniref:hypothetical protein n=1 Tax=Paraglaciecola sp. MB-3u-78 TaxID=2058332 RepID=UPI0018E3A7E5|nr:hypothetical protein [Paraglaciecola sp. MB-3u-78]
MLLTGNAVASNTAAIIQSPVIAGAVVVDDYHEDKCTAQCYIKAAAAKAEAVAKAKKAAIKAKDEAAAKAKKAAIKAKDEAAAKAKKAAIKAKAEAAAKAKKAAIKAKAEAAAKAKKAAIKAKAEAAAKAKKAAIKAKAEAVAKAKKAAIKAKAEAVAKAKKAAKKAKAEAVAKAKAEAEVKKAAGTLIGVNGKVIIEENQVGAYLDYNITILDELLSITSFGVTNRASDYSASAEGRDGWMGEFLTKKEWNDGFKFDYLGSSPTTADLASFESLFGLDEEAVAWFWLSSENSDTALTKDDGTITNVFKLYDARAASQFVAFNGSTLVSQSVNVSEPSIIIILALGMTGLAIRRFKKKS